MGLISGLAECPDEAVTKGYFTKGSGEVIEACKSCFASVVSASFSEIWSTTLIEVEEIETQTDILFSRHGLRKIVCFDSRSSI